jgi:tRNA (Thr-GGU) A37 N-methylase
MSGVDLVDGTPILDLKVRYTHPIIGLKVLMELR